MFNWLDANTPAQVVSNNYFLEVLRGRITGHELVTVYGWNSSIGSSPETIGAHSTSVRNYQSSATVVQLSSASANDTSAGTGARTVSVSGLDTNLDPLTETVTLNGQTGVSTTGQFRYINKVEVLTVGSGLKNAGAIYTSKNGATLSSGVPSTATDILDVVATGDNVSSTAVYTVKKDRTGFLMGFNVITGVPTATSALTVFKREHATSMNKPILATSLGQVEVNISNGLCPITTLTAGDTIEFQAFNSTSIGIGVLFTMLLIKTT